MTDKVILNILLKDAGVKRSALLAENIVDMEKYLDISDDDLKSIRWVDKKGKYIQMITDEEIDKIIVKRSIYLAAVEQSEQRRKIESVALQLSEQPIIRKLLNYFVPPKKAVTITTIVQSFENIKVNSLSWSQALISVSNQERLDMSQFFTQQLKWDANLLEKMLIQVEILTRIIILLGKINNKPLVGISSSQNGLIFKKFLLKNWVMLQKTPLVFLPDIQHLLFDTGDNDIAILNIIASLFSLKQQYFDIAILFLEKIIGMENTTLEMAQEAISTGNPFLFRSLFLSFPEAREFAVGGKLNSSLETKYGYLFETLVSAFGNCREIYDGGVDVVVGKEAFDIKSGPAVMNKSMVDAFSAKQRLIQEENLLPEISTYKIALGYGKREKLNSFMAKIDTEILTAREAWTKITGVEHSPEIVFAIAGLVARIFSSKSIVNQMLGSGENYVILEKDDEDFNQFLLSTFDPIQLTPEAQQEIDFINSLLR
ncbi:hypothetical protein Cylst_1714 [Cylindrospermum stagnale PCC 7417]|uniref:Uncharacterized protein n=1 Tax=Cylindrospermum stagnale PCC 7417 TaxID=56107 RepID=K9WW13_9NOST|nr:hypothetical protein [Cylindrospermum stagnale]AFZ23986.1 hypothetical protein Cylst_1714 [Cylindrospermum stagnale PCC 7417]